MTSRHVRNSHRLNAYMGKSISFHYFMITTTPSISPECWFVNGGRVSRQSYLTLHVLTKSVVRRFRPSKVIVFITGKWNVWVFFKLLRLIISFTIWNRWLCKAFFTGHVQNIYYFTILVKAFMMKKLRQLRDVFPDHLWLFLFVYFCFAQIYTNSKYKQKFIFTHNTHTYTYRQQYRKGLHCTVTPEQLRQGLHFPYLFYSGKHVVYSICIIECISSFWFK